jgi:hypothetical protein
VSENFGPGGRMTVGTFLFASFAADIAVNRSAAVGFEAMKQHLTGKAVPYRVNQVPNGARWQIFLRDPNNVEIELNFEVKNETAA